MNSGRETVLVVDDNAMNLELATELLQAAGFEVLQAERAVEGIAIARTHRPDVILMDIGLPGMDGYSALREWRADEITRGIPMIALTAFAMDDDKLRALDAGFDSFITKPIQTRSFTSTVRRIIDASKRSE